MAYSREMPLDADFVKSASELQYFFAGSCLTADGCGLLFEDASDKLITMVKIRIKPNHTFDLQLLFKNEQEKMAAEVGKYLLKSLTY